MMVHAGACAYKYSLKGKSYYRQILIGQNTGKARKVDNH